MAITQLDSKTALILIDLQKGIVQMPVAHPIQMILERARALADAFRRRRLPVVLVNVAGVAPGRADQPTRIGDLPPGWTDFAPELAQSATDRVITKRTWGAFTNTGLSSMLGQLGVTQIVLAGVATSVGVESTARQAHELGLNVTLAVDAMTDRIAEAHDHSISRIFPRIGETGTTEEILLHLAAQRQFA